MGLRYVFSLRAFLRFLFSDSGTASGVWRRLGSALLSLALIALFCRASGELLACLARQAPRGSSLRDIYASLLVALTVSSAGVALLPLSALAVQVRALWRVARRRGAETPPAA